VSKKGEHELFPGHGRSAIGKDMRCCREKPLKTRRATSMAGRVRKAVVLCGGEGTRLRPFSFSTPKHLMPVANRPVIAWIFDTLFEAGIRDVAVVVSPLNERIFQRELGSSTEHGMQLSFVVQEHPKGLAHAVACARPFVGDSPFLLYLGDNLFEHGVSELAEAFGDGSHAASIALTEVPDPTRFGVARLEGQTILELVEKPRNPPSSWAVAGAYAFTAEIFEAIEQISPSARGELEITDAIQVLIERAGDVNAHFVRGWWKDVGLPRDLILASELMIRTMNPRIDGDVDDASRLDGHVVMDEGASVRGSLLRGPCVVASGAQIIDSEIGPNVTVGADCLVTGTCVRNSILMDSCRIEKLPSLEDSIVGRRSKVSPRSSSGSFSVLLGDDSSLSLDL